MLIAEAVRGIKMVASVQPVDEWKLVSWRKWFGKWSVNEGQDLGVAKSRENIRLRKHRCQWVGRMCHVPGV